MQLQTKQNPLIEEADRKKNEGKHDEAIKICEKILLNDLHCTEAYEEIGDNYLSLRQYHRAEKALTQAVKKNPASPNAHYLLGFVYSCINRWPESIKELEVADQLYPNHPEIIRCLGWSMYHSGQRKRGIILLERAINLSPTDPLILNDLAVCYLNDKNFERSALLFKRTLEVDPHNSKAKECLNAVRFFQREFEKIRKNQQNNSQLTEDIN